MRRRILACSAATLLLLSACSSEEPDADDGTPAAGGTSSSSGGAATAGGSPGAGGVASGGTNDPGAGGSPGVGGGAPGVGGDDASGGADPGAGGMDAGSGGMDTSAGGMDTGSGGADMGSGFTCPSGSEDLSPVVEGKTATQIQGVPEINNGGFLEGPVWFEDKLYLSQIIFTGSPESSDLLAYSPDGGFEVFIASAGTNGLAVDSTGRLIGASQVSAGVIAFDIESPSTAPTDIVRMYNGNTFNSPNDVTVRSDGTIYFTDPNYNCPAPCGQGDVQGVYRVPPGGEAELLVTTQQAPNGISLSPDESILYIGGTTLTAHPVMADGSVGEGTDFGGVMGTDGLAVDCAGNVYVALHNDGKIVVLDSDGTQYPGEISVTQPTNIAFGGPENKTMYITSFGDNRGQLRSVEMEVPGFPF